MIASKRTAYAIALAALCSMILAPVTTRAAGDPDNGRRLAYTCHGCHGIENYRNAYPNYSVPKLGGQRAEYMVAALGEYQAKARWHPTMQGLSSTLSAQDRADVAAFFQATPVVSAGKPVGAAPAAAQTCAACHGPDGVGILPEYPTIAGQHADYLVRALRDYRSGRRRNAVMNGFAQQLSDADIAAVAAYFSSQPGLYTPRGR